MKDRFSQFFTGRPYDPVSDPLVKVVLLPNSIAIGTGVPFLPSFSMSGPFRPDCPVVLPYPHCPLENSNPSFLLSPCPSSSARGQPSCPVVPALVSDCPGFDVRMSLPSCPNVSVLMSRCPGPRIRMSRSSCPNVLAPVSE